MCGIVAELAWRGYGASEGEFQRAVASIRHRGPDGQKLLRKPPVTLAHARLSIVDIASGDQPLLSADGSLALVANGEIYNANDIFEAAAAQGLRPLTGSDNEAILLSYQLWPDDFCDRLKGMFAFVIADFRTGRLVAARDRVGIKPLYWHRSGKHVLFASEIGALLQFKHIQTRPDAEGVAETLTFGYTMLNRTVFHGIEAFPPGHSIALDFARPEGEAIAYWRPDRALEVSPTLDEASHVKRLRQAVDHAVTSHTMGEADYLLYLSGGLDSSIIADAWARSSAAKNDLTSLTLSFEEGRFDEVSEAQVLAERLGLAHVPVEDEAWTLDDLEACVRNIQQPQIVTLDLSMQSLSRKARDLGCKFVFAGDGADEILGGYDHFGLAKARDFAWSSLPPSIRPRALRQAMESRGYPADFWPHFMAVTGAPDTIDYSSFEVLPWYPIWLLNDRIRQKVMPNDDLDPLAIDGPMAVQWRELSPATTGFAPIQSYIAFELVTRLPNWILLKSDRNAMRNSIEVRVPFLDCEVIDAALACPPELTQAPLHEKLALKMGYEDRLESDLIQRRKRAFNTPHGWVFRNHRAQLDDLLCEEELGKTGLFDCDQIALIRQQVQQAYRDGKQPDQLLPTLEAQTLLGVITTQMIFARSYEVQPQPIDVLELEGN